MVENSTLLPSEEMPIKWVLLMELFSKNNSKLWKNNSLDGPQILLPIMLVKFLCCQNG